ncbi:MAG: DNA-processing protein DprA [Patescibacteria group bacterium]
MITDEQLIWIAILECPGIGVMTFNELLKRLDLVGITPLQFWDLSENEIKALNLLRVSVQVFILHRQNFSIKKLKAELLQKNIAVLLKKDDQYPALLKHAPDAPPVLFIQGILRERFSLPIAVVGTRQITSYGRVVTKLLTTELVQQGCEIISGFMYGVDAVAHQAALEANGYTVGVLGYGFDFCFPEYHLKLQHLLLEKGGALITEYLPTQPPVRGLFPQRNRIVAGMSKGILVTEAAADSGSKITARCAAEYGRDVFAIPGSITSKYSDGTKDLVNIGAKLVTSSQDILIDYFPRMSEKSGNINTQAIMSQAETETEKRVLELLLGQSLSSDEIAEELQLMLSELLTAVSALELKGIILSERGKYSVIL